MYLFISTNGLPTKRWQYHQIFIFKNKLMACTVCILEYLKGRLNKPKYSDIDYIGRTPLSVYYLFWPHIKYFMHQYFYSHFTFTSHSFCLPSWHINCTLIVVNKLSLKFTYSLAEPQTQTTPLPTLCPLHSRPWLSLSLHQTVNSASQAPREARKEKKAGRRLSEGQ